METTTAKLKSYRRYARKLEANHLERIAERRKRALAAADQAAGLLKQEFGVSRVVLFGSLLHPGLFHMRSDVDLAIWDIQHYYRAVACLLDIDPDISFDLIPIEDAKESLTKLIEKEGVDL